MAEILPPLTKTILAYGLAEGRDLPDEYYVEVLKDVTNFSHEQAEKMYFNTLRPLMNKLDEISGMTESEIKKKR